MRTSTTPACNDPVRYTSRGADMNCADAEPLSLDEANRLLGRVNPAWSITPSAKAALDAQARESAPMTGDQLRVLTRILRTTSLWGALQAPRE